MLKWREKGFECAIMVLCVNLSILQVVSIKDKILMFSFMAIFVYAFHLFYFSRLHVFGTFSILLLIESIVVFSYYLTGLEKYKNGDVNSASEVIKILDE